jgi:hypothetical protein
MDTVVAAAEMQIRLCPQHWGALRGKLESFGLDRYISKSGEELMRRLSNPNHSKETFDPLFFASWAINKNAIENDISLVHNANCPICLLGADEWIDNAAEDAYSEATRLGLIATS